VIVLIIIVPYAVLLALRRGTLKKLRLPPSWRRFVMHATAGSQENAHQIHRKNTDDEQERQAKNAATRKPARERPCNSAGKLAWQMVGAPVIIILGSIGLVRSVLNSSQRLVGVTA
jgi:hypothetical protein